MIKYFYLTHRWDPNRYYHSRTVNLEVTAMKEYFTFRKAQRLEPHHQMVWCHIEDLIGEVLPLCRDAVSIFYWPSQLGCHYREMLTRM